MNTKKTRFVSILTLLCLTLLFTISTASARSRLAVELVSFTAVPQTGSIRLTWETATELDTAAFILKRDSGTGFVTLTTLYQANGNPYPNNGVIVANGSPASGAVYVAIDQSVTNGQIYTYQLVEIESNNNQIPLQTVTITAGATATPTNIPIGPNTNPTAGAATNTPASQISNTAQPTNTPLPAATATSTRTFITATPRAAQTAVPSSTPVVATDNNVASTNNIIAATNTPTTAPVAVAQTEPTPPTPIQSDDNGYPAAEPPTPAPIIEATATPYPAGFIQEQRQPTPTIIAIIGDDPRGAAADNNDSALTTEAATETQSNGTTVSSVGILWSGFLLSLIILGAAIYGSIVLFVRKRN